MTTQIRLIDQFVISNKEKIVAQELFSISGLDYLYRRIHNEFKVPKLASTRYIFIRRRFDRKKQEWTVIGNRTYEREGWARRAFEANRKHILDYGGYH